MDLIDTTLNDIFPARNMALLHPKDRPISWKGFLIFKRSRSTKPIENSVFPFPFSLTRVKIKGVAQPCQGWGRGFESLHPLHFPDRKVRGPGSKRPGPWSTDLEPRIVDAEPGLLGMVARSGSIWVEGVGLGLAVLAHPVP